MESIQTKFTKKIYQNETFAIFATADGFSAKGDIIDSIEMLLNETLILSGTMQKTKFGDTFCFDSYEFASVDNELFYFLHQVVGLGEKVSQNICKLADSTLEFEQILSKTPSKLMQIEGIGKKRFEKIVQGWEEKRALRTLWEFLQPYGVTNAILLKVYEGLGEQSIAIIKQNPYAIASVKGIGFKKADSVARAMGESAGSMSRLKACLIYCLQNYMIAKGHTLIDKNSLFAIMQEQSYVVDAFELEDDLFEELLLQMRTTGQVSVVDAFISLPKYEKMESAIIEIFKHNKEVKKTPLTATLDQFMKTYENDEGVLLGKKQKEAIELACSGANLFAITGYAGTGKTTVSKAILKLFEKKHGKGAIICCALSGVAANRIKKQSGFASMTIHSLLGYDNQSGGFLKNKDKPIEHKVVLVDEASMVDITIFYSLLQAIDFDNTTLILLGDPAQLPPVGAAEIFSDAVSFELIQNITLDTIYRQKEDAVIKHYAQEVRFGKVPLGYEGEFSDFYFISRCQEGMDTQVCQENTVEYIKKIALRFADEIQQLLQKDKWAALTHFQIVTPMKETPLGTKNLNKQIQQVLLPNKTAQITVQDKIFKLGDKVIHLKNKNMDAILEHEIDLDAKDTKEVRVFNGQIGMIEYIDNKADEILIYYPNEKYYVYYGKSDFASGAVDLAYAISGHKSQGSEYQNTVIPLTMSHYVMLNNKLLYTMMTRAKGRLVFVGDKKAFEVGCVRKDETKRQTLMKLLH
ncbi:MAG: AAA family ATPase [Campylobacterota bacterium]